MCSILTIDMFDDAIVMIYLTEKLVEFLPCLGDAVLLVLFSL